MADNNGILNNDVPKRLFLELFFVSQPVEERKGR